MNIPQLLNTGVKNVKNVNRYMFGSGSRYNLKELLEFYHLDSSNIIVFVDIFFKTNSEKLEFLLSIGIKNIHYIDSCNEPTTDYINELVSLVNSKPVEAVIGIGGGTVLDTAKAVSNILGNGGYAEDYQGWDLLKKPGVFKIGIPTISGTGAEATRTCVMTNKKTGLKLGMNSDYTVFDQVILDPDFLETVPIDQYFYTGMDAYIHCFESLSGIYRNAIGDAFSRETLSLCENIFLSDDSKSKENREKLMVASYLGGSAIATSYVGLVHPLSAALSVVFGTHHCVANCIVMNAMEEFYPVYYNKFWEMVKINKVSIPKGITKGITDEQFENLYKSTIVHSKPLTNALGESFMDILTKEKIRKLFELM